MGKTRQPQQRTKPDLVTREERRIYRELRQQIDTMGPEARAMLLLVARESVRPGTMNDLLFRGRAI